MNSNKRIGVVCVGQSLGMTETLKLRFSKDEAHHIINPEIVNKPSDILPVIEENGTNLQTAVVYTIKPIEDDFINYQPPIEKDLSSQHWKKRGKNHKI